jgi:hypothetical protein
MQAVILVLLLVAGSLVHGAPQAANEGDKSVYKYRKGSINIINAVAAVGYSSFFRDMVADTQAYNIDIKKTSPNVGILLRGHTEFIFFLGKMLVCTNFPTHTLLSELKDILMTRYYPSGNVSNLSRKLSITL